MHTQTAQKRVLTNIMLFTEANFDSVLVPGEKKCQQSDPHIILLLIMLAHTICPSNSVKNFTIE